MGRVAWWPTAMGGRQMLTMLSFIGVLSLALCALLPGASLGWAVPFAVRRTSYPSRQPSVTGCMSLDALSGPMLESPHRYDDRRRSMVSHLTAVVSSTLAVCLCLERRGWHQKRQVTARNAAAVGTSLPAEQVDVAVVGAGPAGTLMAYLLAERHGASVCLIDPKASSDWPNNYGVWQAEWDALEKKLELGLNDCLSTTWSKTDCYFGGSWDLPVGDCLQLSRGYARVDRKKLKARLQSPRIRVLEETIAFEEAVASNIYSGNGLRHDAEGSSIVLSNGQTLRAKLVVDATGSESRLTRRLVPPGEPESPLPGYQIAWGCEVIVDGPTHYDPDAMTLFDYRTDHLSFDPKWEERAVRDPTFMYVMPLGKEDGGERVFFEETSLVARPAVSFEECKRRCFARLKHLGISYRPETIRDEEFCYIPMGGALPEPGQRVIAFGGAAAMVHPSTGYQLCRMMAASSEVAEVIGRELQLGTKFQPDAAAAAAYDAIWSSQNIAQRDFAVFGGDFLQSLDVEGLRGWFQGFFQLDTPLWAGFLAGWPTLPGNTNHETWWARISFGVQLLVKIPVPIALRLVQAIVGYSLTYGTSLVRSVTPFFGTPPSYKWIPPVPADEIGDVAVKQEARKMMSQKA